MPTRRTPGPCSCGGTYQEFRTGETFRSVRRMMHDDPHPVTGGWRWKHRRGVLGYWRALKLMLFESAHGYCDEPLRKE